MRGSSCSARRGRRVTASGHGGLLTLVGGYEKMERMSGLEASLEEERSGVVARG